MERRTFLACGAAFVAGGLRAARAADAVRMPLRVENNRIYTRFGYPAAGGSIEPIVTNVDTGGGAVVLARSVVERLGLATHSDGRTPPGMVLVDLHEIRADVLHLPVRTAATTVAPTTVFHPGASAPAFVPGSVLADHAVTFDYTKGELWLDGPPMPGAMPLAVRVAAGSAFPRVELEIDGERMGFLLDTGASFTMLSQSVIDRLRSRHPDWTYVEGAYGPANMIGKGDLSSHMLRIPSARWGAFELAPLDVVSRASGTFEQYMSRMMSAPIVGALAGNVLRNFALRLDYRASVLDALFSPQPWPQEFTLVPLVIHAERDGGYTVAGGAASTGIAGARLLAVDGQSVTGRSLYDVQDLLRGAAGTEHAVRVRDAGGERVVRLRVTNVF